MVYSVITRFVDRDMFMRHLGGGIGHTTDVGRNHSQDIAGDGDGEVGMDDEQSNDGTVPEDSDSQSDSTSNKSDDSDSCSEEDTGYASF